MSALFGGATRPTHKSYQAHDHIDLLIKTHPRVFERCGPLYEKGMSLREIAKQTGIPKTSIKEALNAAGVALRNYSSGRYPLSKRATVQKPGRPPYGYGYLDGQLAIDPREYSVVKQILDLWQSGKTFNAIAAVLNKKKIKSRNQKKWTRSVVRGIVIRHEARTQRTEGK